MKNLLIVVTGLFVLAGCSQTPDINQAKQSLLDVDRVFSTMSVDSGLYQAFDHFMADSATILRDNAHPIMGREAIRELYAGAGGTLSWEPIFADVSRSADLGYTIGKYKYVLTDTTGAERVSDGYYITIWKKQPDGQWKYVFDTGTSGTPPEENENM